MIRTTYILVSTAAMLLVAAISTPSVAQSDYNGHAAAIEAAVPGYLENFLVPGAAVALIEGGEIVYEKGFGMADIAEGKRVTPSTGFNIGSISKTVAAWGVMRLVEEGRIELDAPVQRYLTRWQLPESEYDATGVTVRRLLSHTAGLSLHGYPGFGPDDELPTIEASLSGDTNGSDDVRLIMEPGSQWRYSGGGYTMLQLLVEEVTGRSFADYLLDAVLQPLGMTRSNYTLTPEILAGSAEAYDEFGEPTPNPRFTAQAAAGLHTTVHDLAIFAAAGLSQGRGHDPGRGVLKPETVKLMMTPAPASDSSYGLGYGVSWFEDGKAVAGHGGANRGWHANFQIVPETGNGIAIVTNGSNGWSVHRQIYCDWVGLQTGRRPKCPVSIRFPIVSKLHAEGVDAAVQHYKDLKAKDFDSYNWNEWALNGIGYLLLGRERPEDALEIFKLNVAEYPEAWNPYDSLGEAYLAIGNEELAIANYEKSLELNPENENAAAVLKRLRGE
ncbi:MAG: class A beta-lactamase-related serine hydrolase [Rhodothermia bacterium]|nr:class A beta-lactamase-related serine hydrolase [Rhodothermia bacterium]